MEWLAENWLWVAGGALILLLIYFFTRPRSKRTRELTRAEQERLAGVLMAKLTDALEGVVDDTIGRHYTRQDRKKIAMGMIAVMMADRISLEQLTSDRALFAAVMAKSVATLTAGGHISAR